MEIFFVVLPDRVLRNTFLPSTPRIVSVSVPELVPYSKADISIICNKAKLLSVGWQRALLLYFVFSPKWHLLANLCVFSYFKTYVILLTSVVIAFSPEYSWILFHHMLLVFQKKNYHIIMDRLRKTNL